MKVGGCWVLGEGARALHSLLLLEQGAGGGEHRRGRQAPAGVARGLRRRLEWLMACARNLLCLCARALAPAVTPCACLTLRPAGGENSFSNIPPSFG